MKLRRGSARVLLRIAILVALALVSSGCGYAPVYGTAAPSGSLSVRAGSAYTPHVEALDTALNSAMAELAREGIELRSEGYPRLVVEILRADEVPAGIAAVSTPTGGGSLQPRGRGMSVGLTGRAWLEESAGAARARATGDVRRVVVVASGSDASRDSGAHAAALRTAARQLGVALVRRVLGYPEPAIEPL